MLSRIVWLYCKIILAAVGINGIYVIQIKAVR